MSNSSIWPIDRTLPGANTLGQSRPGSNDNEGVLRISQISMTGASPSDGLMSYPGNSLLGVAQSARAVEYTECTPAEGLDPPQECPGYDTKQSVIEVPVMLVPGVVAPDRVLLMG